MFNKIVKDKHRQECIGLKAEMKRNRGSSEAGPWRLSEAIEPQQQGKKDWKDFEK